MPWEGSSGADNVATDFRTSRVPSEYKRVVGDSFLKYVWGLDSTHIAKKATIATTMINIILNDEWICDDDADDDCADGDLRVQGLIREQRSSQCHRV